jgi:hypothetical protein
MGGEEMIRDDRKDTLKESFGRGESRVEANILSTTRPS